MSQPNSLIPFLVLGLLSGGHLVRSDNVTTTDDPANSSTVSKPTDSNVSTSVEGISSTAPTSLPTIIIPATTTTTAPTATDPTTTLTSQPATSTSTTTTTTTITTTTKTTKTAAVELTTAPSTVPTSKVYSTETSDMTTTSTKPTTTGAAATLCPCVEESFFGQYGLIVFIVAVGIILLLLYTILMLLLLPRILNRSRKGGRYTVTKGGRKSKDHQGIPPLAIGVDEDTQSTSKVVDHGPLMLVTALDSVALVSEQDDEDVHNNGPLNHSKDDDRKGSSDQGNVSTFLLRQTSIRLAEEGRRAEAEAQQCSRSPETEGPASATLVTTGSSSQMDGNYNIFDSHVTPVFGSQIYGGNNDITEV